MKSAVHAILAVFAAAALAGTAGAQVKIEVRLEYPSVLVCENLHAFVTIKNQTGAPMVLNPDGISNFDIRLAITRDANHESSIPRSSVAPLLDGMMIRDGESCESLIDVAHAYDIGGEGRFAIVAEVEWKGRLFRSEAVSVDIVKGIEITSTDAALNGYDDLIRRYSLRYWSRGGYEHLFLAVEQPDSRESLGVFDLGCVVRVFKPTLIVESSGDVMVVHQSGPDRYTRTAFRSTKSEVVFIDQVYLKADGTPFEQKRVPGVQSVPQPQPAKKQSWWSRFWRRDGAAKPQPSKPEAPPPAESDTISTAKP